LLPSTRAVQPPDVALAPTVIDHLDDNLASEFVSGALPKSAVTKVEGHLAKCRDCRTLVAALAADSANDSNAATVPHEKLSPSQVALRPTRKLTVGDKVGRYLILTTLGAGGMGVVFAAYDPQLDRKVALKLLRAGVNYNTKDARTRLRREAQAIAQLSHPNVVGVYDVGATDEGDLYIAMEFVEGDTLSQWLKKYPRTWREIVDVFLQAARGLIAAHNVGLLHRDFKPDNVLVGDNGRVRVTDFGLARSVMAPPQERSDVDKATVTALNVDLTATGTVLGTPRYMPPEQLVGPDIDARADQFSFCVALYEALYGQHPLPDATSVSMLEKGDAAYQPPDVPKVPAEVSRTVMRGLHKDRSKRFPSMAALVSELVPRPTRAPARYAFAALAMLLLLGGATAAMWRHNDTPEEIMQAPDNKGVQPLIDKLNQREEEYRRLLAEVKRLRHNTDELVVLRTKLEKKEQEIKLLIDKVTELSARPTAPAPSKGPSQSLLVTFAVSQAEYDLEGCFKEWNERVKGEADMQLNMVINQAGQATAPPNKQKVKNGPESMSLRLCVWDAVARVKYPPGPDILDLEITVQWSEGLLNLAPRVVGRRQLPKSLGEL